MASFTWPPSGSGNGVTIYANFAAFPLPGSVPVGTLAIDASTGDLYEQFGGSWQILAQLGGGGGGAPFQEIPSGAINNVNVNFTLAHTPASNSSLALFLDGKILEQGVEYNLVSTAITMVSPPLFAQELYAVGSMTSGGGSVSPLTTKGDLYGFSTLDARLPVGTDGQVLTANSAAALGVSWQAAATGAVDDVNGVTGSVIVAAGTGISVGTAGQTITVTNTAPAVTVLGVSGTRASPNLITAVGGLAFAGTKPLNKNYIAGNAAPIVVTANPQIAAGTTDGQQLVLQGRDATNTVTIQSGGVGVAFQGVVTNGDWVAALDNSITLTWDGTNWIEMSRQ